MRSAEVCQCEGMVKPPGTLKNTSTFGLAGSPCSTAISQPFGMNGGHGPHFSDASLNVSASAGSAAGPSAEASDPDSASTPTARSEEHTSELQSRRDLVCRLLLEKKK